MGMRKVMSWETLVTVGRYYERYGDVLCQSIGQNEGEPQLSNQETTDIPGFRNFINFKEVN